jgi:anti-sigma28 factor (negative regulator of flagellin synthesis)
MSEIPAIRQDRVDAIRTAIAQGTYETDAMLNVALDRLLDEIG